jgi:hypothetical protein
MTYLTELLNNATATFFQAAENAGDHGAHEQLGNGSESEALTLIAVAGAILGAAGVYAIYKHCTSGGTNPELAVPLTDIESQSTGSTPNSP